MSAWTEEAAAAWRDELLGYTELPSARRRARAAPYRLHRPHLAPPPAELSAPAVPDTPPTPPDSGTHVSRLYPELLALIFERLPVRDRGRAAQVCRAWRDAADRRSVWRGVEAALHLRRAAPALFASLARRGVRRLQVLSLRRGLRDAVAALPGLESLSLSGCYSVTDAALASAFATESPALRRLDLSLCKQVTDSSLGRIAQSLKNLEELELGGCSNITDTGLLLIAWGLRKLRRLDLRSCWHVTDAGLAHLCGGAGEARGTPELEHLGLQDCQRLTDEALRHAAAGLPRLRSVNLSFCVAVSDAGLRHLARLPQLEDVNLRACDGVSDAGVAQLAEAGRLRALDVSFCDKVGDEALCGGLGALRSLSLSACRVTDEGLERVARLRQLETLNIGQCSRVTDRGLRALGDALLQLRAIDLYGCTGITTHGLEYIVRLPHLKVLNLGLWLVR
ncbi:hypothetical protein EVAR_9478_1 [Eumeta japonica]|uniref:F-box domain-containing protein n=1 Tax=Eumeta variegata TaxID=151549 RepID=A0A4C2A5Q1_EUMVA|nr:hypothetical protein EVAR_9478_1 [Eumeta japonica]